MFAKVGGVRDASDHAQTEAARAAVDRRAAELTELERQRRALIGDRLRALAYVRAFVATGLVEAPVSPMGVATELAMAATWSDPGMFDELEALTGRLAANLEPVRAARWWPEVVWQWPGLPRVAFAAAAAGAPAAWNELVALAPRLAELAQVAGFGAGLLRYSGRDGRAWATLTTICSYR